jgi:SAM-dependent methyltransferase
MTMPASADGPVLGDAFGQVLLRCWVAGARPGQAFEVIERDDGYLSVADAARYFAGPDEWSNLEQRACEQVSGRILDIGCGAGRHAVVLRSSGRDITGLETSPGAASVARERGITVAEGSIAQPPDIGQCQAQRAVLLGADPDVELSKRAVAGLAKLRDEDGHCAAAGATVVEVGEDDVRWWTWAGGRGNATLAAALPQLVDEDGRIDNHSLRLRSDVTLAQLRAVVDATREGEMAAPEVTEDAVRELKFGEILPPDLAVATLAERLVDESAAKSVLGGPVQWHHGGAA